MTHNPYRNELLEEILTPSAKRCVPGVNIGLRNELPRLNMELITTADSTMDGGMMFSSVHFQCLPNATVDQVNVVRLH